jgi:hypothetical protein
VHVIDPSGPEAAVPEPEGLVAEAQSGEPAAPPIIRAPVRPASALPAAKDSVTVHVESEPAAPAIRPVVRPAAAPPAPKGSVTVHVDGEPDTDAASSGDAR